MAYDEHLADRLRMVLKDKKVPYRENKMMGGLTFMVDDKMCVGIIKNNLMARVGPDIYEEALTKPGCKEMDFTKKPLIGYVYIEPEAIDMDEELEYWVQLSLDFNPFANSSKKKK
ncbi:TfoX/Sxy family protein [Labilibacter marinus]|uniref:TfoX/Sxy family protein n=1 Tax=Labilibacter marinus TaxID=1477105 RepID=UPI00082BDE55|nr:TfoX/Sxy family protein [Labilibacter marinus]